MWNMFLNIFLWCSFSVVIYANNIVPSQTYSIYQQNGYTYPPKYQASNIQSYIPGNTVQNEINIPPQSFRQVLLNKLFTNPSSKASFDPTIANYCTYLNGIENQIPANSIYNNYPIQALVYLKNGTDNIIKPIGSKNADSNIKSKRKPKSKRKQNERYDKDDPIYFLEDRDSNKRGSHTKKISSTNNVENGRDNRGDISKKQRKRRKKNKNVQNEDNITGAENNDENTNGLRRHKKHKKNIEKSSNDINTETKTKCMEDRDDFNFLILSESSANENRETRNSLPERNDLNKSKPSAHEDISKKFLSNLYQYSNPQMTNWFNDYKNFYELILANPPVSVTNKKKSKKKKKGKKCKKNKKRKNTQAKNIIRTSTVVNTDVDDETTTTEKLMYLSEWTETNFNSDITEETLTEIDNENVDDKFSSNEIFQDEFYTDNDEGNNYNEYYEGYIDDYYPQFYDSAAYNANKKEIFLKNLQDNKFFYATDPSDVDLYNYYRKQIYKNSELIPNNNNIEKNSYDETETDDLMDSDKSEKNIEQEVSFHSPPFLESPDFRTRKIEKNEMNTDLYDYNYNKKGNKFIDDKYSTYSKAKSPNFSGDKLNENKIHSNNIETIHAKSKVVSYGPVYKPEESSIVDTNINSWMDPSSKSKSYQEPGTTYVVAESLDSSEIYFK